MLQRTNLVAKSSKEELNVAMVFNAAKQGNVANPSLQEYARKIPMPPRTILVVKSSKEELNVAMVFNAAKERTVEMFGKANAFIKP